MANIKYNKKTKITISSMENMNKYWYNRHIALLQFKTVLAINFDYILVSPKLIVKNHSKRKRGKLWELRRFLQ
jgi:hypothetical protein